MESRRRSDPCSAFFPARNLAADANDEWNAGAAALEYAGHTETARAVTLRVGGDPRVERRGDVGGVAKRRGESRRTDF